jgi:kynurenine formamidase
MCAPSVIASALAGLDRREALYVAAGMFAGVSTLAARGGDSAPIGEKRTIAAGKVLDLTHVLSPAFPIWPGNVPIKLTNVAKVAKDNYYANRWDLAEHHGTHLDAPAHFAAGGGTA